MAKARLVGQKTMGSLKWKGVEVNKLTVSGLVKINYINNLLTYLETYYLCAH